LKIQTAIGVIPRIAQLLSQLFLIWATLNYRVRKTRRAFERELVNQGIKAEDAKRLSKQIKILKDQMMSSIREISSEWKGRH
jgi:hypothetical protein